MGFAKGLEVKELIDVFFMAGVRDFVYCGWEIVRRCFRVAMIL